MSLGDRRWYTRLRVLTLSLSTVKSLKILRKGIEDWDLGVGRRREQRPLGEILEWRLKGKKFTTMAWLAAAKSFHLPAVDVTALRSRAPLAVGCFGCVSMAGAGIGRSSSAFRSKLFASLSISADASKCQKSLTLDVASHAILVVPHSTLRNQT